MKLGLSCAQDDTHLIPFFKELIEKNTIQYVELYIKPTAKLMEILQWKDQFPIVVHAPHTEEADFNEEYLALGIEAQTVLDGITCIYNAGIHQIDFTKYNYATPEIMPYETGFGDKGMLAQPKDVPAGLLFLCVDFAHAYITAQQLKLNYDTLLDEFMALKPSHFHLSNIANQEKDVYAPLCHGYIEIGKLMKHFPNYDYNLTIEVDTASELKQGTMTNDLACFYGYYENR